MTDSKCFAFAFAKIFYFTNLHLYMIGRIFLGFVRKAPFVTSLVVFWPKTINKWGRSYAYDFGWKFKICF